MTINTGIKWFIKFDEEHKRYIYYRFMDKSELAAHKASALKQQASIENAITQFQSYIDDERVVEPEIEQPEEPK